MKKYQLHTTLSSKHWELLNKYTEKFGTQQKVLESALESLESTSNSQHNSALSPEVEERMRLVGEMGSLCIIPREGLKMLIELVDFEKCLERSNNEKHIVQAIEFNYQKPFEKLSLKEVLDGLTNAGRVGNWFDAVNYIETEKYYTMKINHSLGIRGSKFNKVLIEQLFERYGAKTESEISEKNIFIKIHKN